VLEVTNPIQGATIPDEVTQNSYFKEFGKIRDEADWPEAVESRVIRLVWFANDYDLREFPVVGKEGEQKASIDDLEEKWLNHRKAKKKEVS
jgi:hypothetical protein